MSKGVKIVLLVVGVGFLLFVGAIAGVVLWAKHNMANWERIGRQSVADGRAFGETRTPKGCIDEAMHRDKAHHSFNDELGYGFFLRACLETSDAPADYCQDVPSDKEIMASVKFALARCAAYPEIDSNSCARIIKSVQQYCHEPPLKM